MDLSALIDQGWSNASLTFIAIRDGSEVATAAASLATLASGQLRATAAIDIDGLPAGRLDLTLIDGAGNMAWSNSITVDSDGDELGLFSFVDPGGEYDGGLPALQSLRLYAGDDYTDRPITIPIGIDEDLTGKSVIVSAKRDKLSAFSIACDIIGEPREHSFEIAPDADATSGWFPAVYDGVIRIRHNANSEQTIWTGPIKVQAFPTPA
ncbi:hypothetical protein U8335_04000 [Roseiconus lacunae]|uniref:Uncharacterized protein n=1 Tax=Roseiconus lacunae TaxID=2605694 RepID=A0ABT7PHJ8_9BACT|nr:hypothetical protein [Roseiconus lacunae]MDM4015966.1 hypothetical protein [Roseiconus lacunae]WRQ51705.1 hypothetical protein U8335_04000 [Stieleria sp. HD01]